MEQYESNVATVIDILKARKFSASVISAHRICYRELGNFLNSEHQPYSFDRANQWLDVNKSLWPYRKYTNYRHCIQQLEDVKVKGSISEEHFSFRKPPYSQLSPKFKNLLDSFLQDSCITCETQYRIACARFLLYLQDNGLSEIDELNYELIIRFHDEDHHTSQKSKDVYEDLIREFFRYLALKGQCPFGFSLVLNKLLIPKIIQSDPKELISFSISNGSPLKWDEILRFLSELERFRYSKTVLKSSKHILTLLYIFLDMHHIYLSEDLTWYWFYKLQPFLGKSWKQHRRTLSQFLIFLNTGTITTSTTGDPNKIDTLEILPQWEKGPISEYLTLLKREGWQQSTIIMHKLGCLKFCRYLENVGIQGFREVTTEIAKEFNLQDKHSTPEAKAAYNCRIRNFIIYLYEQGFISNPYLYKAIPTLSAPRTSIVQILSKEDVAGIWNVDFNTLSPTELRDYAIVCIGLSMGFRASDICSLRFTDINWKQKIISITQKKTGKALAMPMPIKTGNILFHYIRHGRPKSDSHFVFISHRAPYGCLEPGVCRRALNRFVVERNGKENGFHIVRKTFATNLLEGNVDVELISDMLGHSTNETIRKYLSLDEQHMRMCPLSLIETGISYKGGVFRA